jgi:subtilase family serine protease
MATRHITSLRASCAAIALAGAAALAPAAANAAATQIFPMIAAPAGAHVTALSDSASMSVVLSLPLRDAAGAQAYADAVSNPASPLFQKYLTPAEFGQRFGADAATYSYIRSWAASLGFTVGRSYENHALISLRGTAHQFAELFSTRFGNFATPANGNGQVVLTTPRLPDALVGRVNGVIGLSYAKHDAPLFHRPAGPRTDVGTGKGGGYAPSDVLTAYDISPQKSATKTEVVALFEQGGYNTTDLSTYETQYNLPAVPVTVIGVNGASTQTRFGVLPEDMLDLDVLIGLDQNLQGIRMYVDGTDSFQVALLDALNDMASDNIAKVVSISYGQSEAAQGTSAIQAENTAFLQLRTEGQSVFVSSGDSGADGLTVSDPASQPNVTAVGGTTLNTNPTTQAWSSETVWSGGGGGISSIWAIPSYQLLNGTSVAVANGGSATMRNVPDVAADADPNTGYNIYCPGLNCEGIGWGAVGGTSLAAPIWGAMASVANADLTAAHKPRLGYFNPTVYPLGEKGTGFHDITVGNNGNPGYTAGPGYDDATGLGSIDFGKLLATQKK